YEQPLFPLDFKNVNGDTLHPPPNAVSEDEGPEREPDEPDVLPPSTRRPPEDPKSAGFVVNLMKFERNGSLNAKGAEGLGIRVERVRKQLTGLANCLQLP